MPSCIQSAKTKKMIDPLAAFVKKGFLMSLAPWNVRYKVNKLARVLWFTWHTSLFSVKFFQNATPSSDLSK